jgi:hypothetical protein
VSHSNGVVLTFSLLLAHAGSFPICNDLETLRHSFHLDMRVKAMLPLASGEKHGRFFMFKL